MDDVIKVDMCVIGAGSGGLSVAAGASQMGASTILIERGRMGGDCLNYGCVPSKALLAAGHAAQAVRRAGRFGVADGAPRAEAEGVFAHVHGAIAAIAPNDSQERFEGMGVTVLRERGHFVGPRRIQAGDTVVEARRVVIATGSGPLVPPIDGLADVPYHTNETLFYADRLPGHLVVLGGGPIGIEMAQAHRHLGAEVSVIEMASILPKDDPELVQVVRSRLTTEGVHLYEGAKATRVEKTNDGIAVTIETADGETRVTGTDLLVAVGRKPNLDGLELDNGGIRHTARGITVDDRLRTSDKKVYAVGDVTGGYQFTHMAGHHAGVVLKNALFRLPAKVESHAVPWVTYTAPELAHVGYSEAQARDRLGDKIRILRWPFADNDRAHAEGETEGMIKAIVSKGGRVVGASIVGPAAGELIAPWILAVGQKMNIGAIAGMIAPYPTLGEVSKRAAGSYYTPRLFSETTRKIVRFLGKFG